MGKIIGFTLMAALIFAGFQFIGLWSQDNIYYSHGSTTEFQNRINHTLKFVQKNHPPEYKLIANNVLTIKEHLNTPSFNKRAPLGVSYAWLEKGGSGRSRGLIALLPIDAHCPPTLVENKQHMINCASVIYHEALHHYHFNEGMYQTDSSLEHYHVYRRQAEFFEKMGGSKAYLQWMQNQARDFKSKAKVKE